MAGVEIGKLLQMISGVPLQKVSSVFAEKLSITKRLDGGALGGLMSQVLADGNLSSVMQNPMAALTGTAQSAVSNAATSINSALGGSASSLVSALTGGGGLSSALTALKGSGDNLAGLTNGAQGFFDLLGHANIVDMTGGSPPSALAMSKVTGPLEQATLLASIAASVQAIASSVIAGTMTVSAATAQINAYTAQLNAIVADSSAAITQGQAAQSLLSTVAAVAGALAVPPTFDAEGNRLEGTATPLQTVLSTLVNPSAKAAMDAALAAQIEHTEHDPIDVDALTSLED